ncbi:nucleoside triphosphate pyrophosphatase [Phycisphaerales bacterium AB-hyl4]|uniref:Nucleoside triphosphate pyrophosphatase n=1 Tax=Natronomicrosphaera hydrolytica TaxID=3242702 RepID=A0ABV4U8D6_9BACT
MGMSCLPLILASRSARRAQLLRDAGYAFEQRTPPFDDPPQPTATDPAHSAEQIASDLARQKAMSLHEHLPTPAVVLAADTICVDGDGRLIGQPTDADDAQRMIEHFADATHTVVSGVAVVGPGDERPSCFADTATVHVGPIDVERVRAYIASDQWRGKAGGYNLFERQAAGWPIRVEGDPTTVVGLPMRGVVRLLEAYGVRGGAKG